MAYRIGEDPRVLLPPMVCQDWFFVSHITSDVELPDPGQVKEFLPPFAGLTWDQPSRDFISASTERATNRRRCGRQALRRRRPPRKQRDDRPTYLPVSLHSPNDELARPSPTLRCRRSVITSSSVTAFKPDSRMPCL
jgi:hypothetical protein